MLRPKDIRERIEDIRRASGDPEAAHAMEAALWKDVLVAIADRSCLDPAECARIALQSTAIDFPRWCA